MLKKRTSIAASVLAAILIVILIVAVTRFSHALFKRQSYEKLLLDTSVAFNKKCPLMVDSETRLDKTKAGPGKMFTFYYTLINHTPDASNTKTWIDRYKPSILNNVRNNPGLEILRKNKVTFYYTFNDKNGKPVMEICVTPGDYSK